MQLRKEPTITKEKRIIKQYKCKLYKIPPTIHKFHTNEMHYILSFHSLIATYVSAIRVKGLLGVKE